MFFGESSYLIVAAVESGRLSSNEERTQIHSIFNIDVQHSLVIGMIVISPD